MRYQGVDLPDERDGEMALEAILLFKVLLPSGSIQYREYKSANLHPIEALGMITTMEDTLRATIMRGASGVD